MTHFNPITYKRVVEDILVALPFFLTPWFYFEAGLEVCKKRDDNVNVGFAIVCGTLAYIISLLIAIGAIK